MFAHEKIEIILFQGSRSVEDVDELAHVAGIVVVHQRGNLLVLQHMVAVELPPPGVGDDRDVVLVLAKGRRPELNHVETLVEVFAEIPLAHEARQVAVRRRDEPHVACQLLPAAQAHETAALQDAQQERLHLQRHLADLVKEELRCDVRLVTATNRDLPKLVAEGKFREDLYQRLNVVQMRTPSLREHKDDVPIIANAWWRKFHGNRTLGEEQIAALMDYDYPGNVRELINILDRATALEEDDFELLMREHKEMNAGLAGNLELKSGRIPDKLEDAIRLHVRRVYEKYGENLTRAAEALDVSRNTVRKYL